MPLKISDNWPGRAYHAKPDPAETLVDDDDLTDPVGSWQEADTGLLKAADAVVNRRDEQYGECLDHHAATAALWSVYLGFTVTPGQVSALFILDKLVRSRKEDKPDHWLDVAGYAAVHAKVQAAMEREEIF